MAKKKDTKEAVAISAVPAYEPPTVIRVTKAQAKGIGIGEKVEITVAGEVKSIRKSYEPSDAYEIELEKSKVSGIQTNAADKALRDMAG